MGNLWRRQTGVLGAIVELTVWAAMVKGLLMLVAFVVVLAVGS